MIVDEIDAFWMIAKFQLGIAAPATPDAWAFGDDVDVSDRIVRQILDGAKCLTSSSLADYGDSGLPNAGELHIVLDGRDHPRALIQTSDVRVIPYAKIGEAEAREEGFTSLEEWQAANGEHLNSAPVVLERFRVIHPQ